MGASPADEPTKLAAKNTEGSILASVSDLLGLEEPELELGAREMHIRDTCLSGAFCRNYCSTIARFHFFCVQESDCLIKLRLALLICSASKEWEIRGEGGEP